MDGHFQIHMWVWSLGTSSELKIKYIGAIKIVYTSWGIEYSEVESEKVKEEVQSWPLGTSV